MLANAVKEWPFEWEGYLRHLCMAYNMSVHPSTDYTPSYLIFGCQVRMPINIMFGTTPSHTQSQSEYATHFCQELESANHKVREHLGHRLARQKALHDKKVHGQPFQCRDLVWLHSPFTLVVNQESSAAPEQHSFILSGVFWMPPTAYRMYVIILSSSCGAL